MIAHAWTTLCDRVVVDRDSDNLNLDTIEAIYVNKPDDGEPALVPVQLEVVSLWYRREPGQGALERAHICVLSPELETLAHIAIDIDLRNVPRLRTRGVIDGLMVRRAGTYFVSVDVLDATPAREVARIPLQVELAPRDVSAERSA
jgi:hypothetical protein